MAKSTVLPLIAGATALLLVSKGKKKNSAAKRTWGVRVSSDCSTAEIVDSEKFYTFVVAGFRELVDADPSLTLIQVSDALFYELAPNCTGFPLQPESASVADLYATITQLVGRLMISDERYELTSVGGLLAEASELSLTAWYRKWNNYPTPKLPPAPLDEVAFSSDLSKFKIGPDWYEETVIPFVAAAKASGKLATVLHDFMDRGVIFGRLVVAISELPKDAPRVQAFLTEVEDAIQEAKEDVG